MLLEDWVKLLLFAPDQPPTSDPQPRFLQNQIPKQVRDDRVRGFHESLPGQIPQLQQNLELLSRFCSRNPRLEARDPWCWAFLLVSSPGGFHPQALSEPDLNLSIHPAPIIQPYRISPLSSVQIDEAPCEQEFLAIYPLLYDLSFSCICFLPTELRLCLADSVLYTSQICESVHSSLSNLLLPG